MEDYRSNSNRSKMKAETENKEETPKLKNMLSSPAKRTNRGYLRRLGEVIRNKDINYIKSYLFDYVMIPSLRDGAWDILSNGLHMLLYDGESKKSVSSSHTAYGSFYDDNKGRSKKTAVYYSEDNDRPTVVSRSTLHYVDDVLIPDTDENGIRNKKKAREKAEGIIIEMNRLIEKYGLVRVSQFYESVGITGNYTAEKYGWNNIKDVRIIEVRNGYVIEMPKPYPIDSI